MKNSSKIAKKYNTFYIDLALGLIVSFVSLYLILMVVPYVRISADDIAHVVKVRESGLGYFNYYLTSGGRYAELFLTYITIPLVESHLHLTICCSIFFSFIIIHLFLLNLLAHCSTQKNIYFISSYITSIFFLLIYSMSAAFFVVDWYIAYFLPFILSLLYFSLLLNFRINFSFLLILSLLTVLIIGSAELVGWNFILINLYLLLFSNIYKKNKFLMCYIIILNLLCFLFEVLSPGNFARSHQYGLPLLEKFQSGGLSYLKSIGAFMLDKRFILIFLIVPFLELSVSTKKIFAIHILLILTVLVNVVLLTVGGYVESRHVNIAYIQVFIFYFLFAMLFSCIIRNKLSISVSLIAILFLMFILPGIKTQKYVPLPSYVEQLYFQYKLLPNYEREINHRYYMLENHESGLYEQISFPNVVGNEGNLFFEGCNTNWIAIAFAQYYGVDKICLSSIPNNGDSIIYLNFNQKLFK